MDLVNEIIKQGYSHQMLIGCSLSLVTAFLNISDFSFVITR